MGEIITRTVVRACWGTLIPITIGLDLNHISIPISFSFKLPFLPGIPFWVPEVRGIGTMNDFFFAPSTFAMLATSSFLFFALCKLADGLVEYVTLVVQYLTNVQPARQDGKLQGGMNPIKSITGDLAKLASPITGAFKGVGKFVKGKAIDQKIARKGGNSDGGDIDYSSIKKPGVGDDSQKAEKGKGGDLGKKKPGDEGGGGAKKSTWKPGSGAQSAAGKEVDGIKGKAAVGGNAQSAAAKAAKKSSAAIS